MEKKKLTPLNAGLIISLVLIAISVILYVAVTDMKQQQQFGYFSYLILIAGLIYTCLTYAKQENKNVTFGNVFSFGFKTTAVVTSIMVIFTILSLTVLFPEMKSKAMDVAREQMETNDQLSDAQIDQALEMTNKFFLPFAIGGSLIGYLIIGAIGSLIGAAAAPKNPNPIPFESDNLS
ncbi:MAG: DUF4199 domain-containing protein [Chitinophagaceae bacterium]|jgi:uncharacterized membrane protein|nr:DUF4199 domain-containing protein [Chitinophagaceae bacterium]MCU0403635.1 DUF4199 domain-containing protein [Chitinophagaceae bacterium]